MQKPEKIILGIDPGTLIMGYSIIEIQSSQINIKIIDVLKLPQKKDNYERLKLVHRKITELVETYLPTEMAIEAPFFGKNVQSMLKLGRAQGVAIAAAMNKNIPVTEYSPRRIKQSIAGSGDADKEQVWKMLLHLVKIEAKPKYFDATDALAVAICHHFSKGVSERKPKKKKMNNAWEKFATENPKRIL